MKECARLKDEIPKETKDFVKHHTYAEAKDAVTAGRAMTATWIKTQKKLAEKLKKNEAKKGRLAQAEGMPVAALVKSLLPLFVDKVKGMPHNEYEKHFMNFDANGLLQFREKKQHACFEDLFTREELDKISDDLYFQSQAKWVKKEMSGQGLTTGSAVISSKAFEASMRKLVWSKLDSAVAQTLVLPVSKLTFIPEVFGLQCYQHDENHFGPVECTTFCLGEARLTIEGSEFLAGTGPGQPTN